MTRQAFWLSWRKSEYEAWTEYKNVAEELVIAGAGWFKNPNFNKWRIVLIST